MRNQAMADKLKDSSPATAHDLKRDIQHPAKHVTIDLEGLRSLGYLPEQSVAIDFANYYRRIKRPLVDKAATGDVTGRPVHVIMVTSALPGDGKTFTSINLALALALERDMSVLLVDCDVVRRRTTHIFGLADERGLLDGLHDDSIDVESLVIGTNVRGLSLLPAGTPAEGTTELLSSNRMRQIAGSLFGRVPRRLVLLDSPPLLITDEARALVRIAGQVVLVVRADHTPRQAVLDAIRLFHPEQAGGIVLNDVHVSRADKYYHYDYGSYKPRGNAP